LFLDRSILFYGRSDSDELGDSFKLIRGGSHPRQFMRVSRNVSIHQRMILGYSVIAVAVSIAVIVSFFIFKKTKDLDEHITNVQIPALGNLKRIEQCIIDHR
jgi:hypothetical protein